MVLAERSASESCLRESSKALIWARTGSMRLTARSLAVPKTLARAALNTVGSFGGVARVGAEAEGRAKGKEAGAAGR